MCSLLCISEFECLSELAKAFSFSTPHPLQLPVSWSAASDQLKICVVKLHCRRWRDRNCDQARTTDNHSLDHCVRDTFRCGWGLMHWLTVDPDMIDLALSLGLASIGHLQDTVLKYNAAATRLGVRMSDLPKKCNFEWDTKRAWHGNHHQHLQVCDSVSLIVACAVWPQQVLCAQWCLYVQLAACSCRQKSTFAHWHYRCSPKILTMIWHRSDLHTHYASMLKLVIWQDYVAWRWWVGGQTRNFIEILQVKVNT